MSHKSRYIVCLMALVVMTAQARRPRQPMAVGAAYYYATEYRQHGLGAKLQLGVDSHWRIEPEMVYFAQNRDVTTLQLNANVHYVQPIVGALALYPFVGVSYSHWGYEGPDASRWGINLGAGLEMGLGSSWVAVGELRYMLVANETQAVSTLGLRYKF